MLRFSLETVERRLGPLPTTRVLDSWSITASLDFRAEVSPGVLADVIVRKIAGLDSPGWILVLCQPDAEATWGMAPPAGRSRLLNGKEYCGTVAAYLPGS